VFCTYLTVYRGSKLPPFYIGHTTVEKLSKGYRGSVSSRKYRDLWKHELKNNPHLFHSHIISKHDTRMEAVAREVSLQMALNVVTSPMYTNMAIASGRPSLIGRIRSKEHCLAISKAKKGKPGHKPGPRSEAWMEKQRAANLGKTASAETKAKMSSAHLGGKRSLETKAKMKAAALARWARKH
jgi:hypothetical protein